ncbi:UbiH/UbiF/VisC/COQ6 family ubiquinone biosynthesis hydroxylase [Shumkonia mesophila]|uniref:UbiH/UbiF/VisC/COQ6 family ubiquinone biosynthesis hydroxylase n=1 Tax=Shumkonia mesophila TaxID=2838854 RepID=UPI002934B9E2|nr:UbiH/UbiF/VisC/COQ6 family ubiquinone biosynthesis hydroxylase [Shumkonia mesophila]
MTASPASPAPLETDVLIVGGGLVGGALACALASAGIASAVIEKDDPANHLTAAFDGRAFATAYATRRMLEALGLWQRIAPEASPILDIRVSEGGSPFFLHFAHGEGGDEPFGHMVEARTMRRAIHARMAEWPAIRLIAPARVVSLARQPGGVEAVLADGRRLRAALAVAADGRGSRLRAEAGIRTTGWPYGQHGIVCTVAHERGHGNVAHEHFLPSGPFAILPLTGNRCSLVWTERSDLAPHLMGLPEADFAAEAARRIGDFLGHLEVVGPRWSYPLGLQFAERAHDRRLALVGDALHAMHPIAGQGLNMGLRDAATLAEVLTDARRLGLDLGDGAALARYDRWRRFDNFMMLVATDGLTRVFANDIRPLKAARDLGLAVVGRIAPLKRLIMRHHMGTLGELPRLLRGEAL